MKSTTSLVAKQYRLQEWTKQMQECKLRPSQMSVKTWCNQHDITVADYYYRLRVIRKACLEQVVGENHGQNLVPVSKKLINTKPDSMEPGLDISVNGTCIHVTETTSSELLSRVLKVITHVE